jgi:hypothetical protein
VSCSDEQVANRNGRDFGLKMSSRGRFATPPISLNRIVARAEGYTYTVKVWDLLLVQGSSSVARAKTLTIRFAFSPRMS